MEGDYREIIDIIKRDTAVSPPDDFTERVMAQLATAPPEPSKSRRPSFLPQACHYFKNIPSGPIGIRECSFYFFLSGFFFLVLGAVLMVGFAGIQGAMPPWLGRQPQIMLLSALLFISLGVALARDGKSAFNTAKFVTLIYIAFVMVNGAFMQIILKTPKALAAGFILANAVMGLLLIVALQKSAYKVRS